MPRLQELRQFVLVKLFESKGGKLSLVKRDVQSPQGAVCRAMDGSCDFSATRQGGPGVVDNGKGS